MEGGFAFGGVLGHEAADPALGDAVGAGGLGLSLACEHGGDDKAAGGHGPACPGAGSGPAGRCRRGYVDVVRQGYSDVVRDPIPMS